MNADTGSSAQGPLTVAVHTHGCKLNQSDSQELTRQFEAAGYRVVESPGDADVVVLNTCTVTATADAKARQFLRRAHRKNPRSLVVATGCYAQRSPQALEAVAGVSIVEGNIGKTDLVATVSAALETLPPGATIATIAPGAPPPAAFPVAFPVALIEPAVGPASQKPGRHRAMVKIQEGCDQVCAYCIVPRVRGRERSIPPGLIVAEIGRRAEEGCREAVLTGTQLGTYGFDIPGADLAGLVRSILDSTSIDRLRVSSLQAQEITPELLDLWSDPRLCPHFHIPLQSGSDPVLRAMRRRYDTGRFARTLDLVRDAVPGVGVTTDIIVGFPGESDDNFRDGYAFAGRMAFSDIHVFPYSSRPGTIAAHLKDTVDDAAKGVRMAQMLELASQGRRRFRTGLAGTVRTVLWEPQRPGGTGAQWSGLTDNYVRVRTKCERNLGNRITMAQLTEPDGDVLLCTVAA